MSKNLFAEKESGVSFSFWLEGDEQADYHIAAFKVEEALFSLTKIEVLLKISSSSLNFTDRLGKRASLYIEAEGLSVPTCFSGIIAEATEFFEAGDALTRFILLPDLIKLEKGPHYRVFQELTVPDIVETILCEHGIANALWQLEGDFAPRRFCMQYGESDLAFMHRILAEEDIFYYFIHEDKGRQRPVLCNNIKLLLDCPNGGNLRHDSHEAHALHDVAGAAGIYCHSLRRSFGAGVQEAKHNKTAPNMMGLHSSAPHFTQSSDGADGAGSARLSGIAHLPMPLCGHRLALQCPFDKSLNIMWYLIAVRHEGIGAAGGLLLRDLADYFTEAMETVKPTYTESVAVNGAYGRAFSADSLLPRLCRVNGGSVYESRAADTSPYGVPLSCTHNKAVHNVGSQQGSAYGKQSGGQAGRKPVYACVFTALDGKAAYRPPMSIRPVIAGPQEAQLIRVDKAMRRYKLALQISAGGRGQMEELCFWAYADSELGAAVAAFAGVADLSAADENIGGPHKKLILEFLGGNPDKPIVLQRSDEKGGLSGIKTFTNGTISGFGDAVFEEQMRRGFNIMPQNKRGDEAAQIAVAPVGKGNYPYIPPYAAQILRQDSSHQAGSGQDFIHITPGSYKAFSSFASGQQAGRGTDAQQGDRSDIIPLARIQADLKNDAEQRQAWFAAGGNAAYDSNACNAPASGDMAAGGSRFLQVGEHQREDIHGIYELNCGEKYLCKTKSLHINASDRLILRGPGGKIIIDKYSIILEAPLIRFKGKLAMEEDVFERQEGVRIAIRDELPLVADCNGDKTAGNEADDGLNS